MMRLLFLCVLLLLPAATVLSEEFEGSADESDDEDMIVPKNVRFKTERERPYESSHTDESRQESPIPVPIIIAVVVVVAISVIAVVGAIMLMKRRKLKQQQGSDRTSLLESGNLIPQMKRNTYSFGPKIYSVPVEQNHKEAV